MENNPDNYMAVNAHYHSKAVFHPVEEAAQHPVLTSTHFLTFLSL
jgi:hypothetical protein